MKTLKFKLVLIVAIWGLLMSSCKSYQNDFINWSDNIPLNSTIEQVKQIQPDYVKIAWDKPEVRDNDNQMFFITDIKGNRDPLKMEYYLEFNNEGFVARFSHK